jgi:hypothetical protein
MSKEMIRTALPMLTRYKCTMPAYLARNLNCTCMGMEELHVSVTERPLNSPVMGGVYDIDPLNMLLLPF